MRRARLATSAGTDRVRVAGCTTHPAAAWVTQQARQPSWQLPDGQVNAHYLIRDRDSKFVPAFDAVFQSEGVEIVRTPYPAPNANAVAERWTRSVRQECLDHLLIGSEAHLRRVLAVYVSFYLQDHPHQGLAQRTLDALSAHYGHVTQQDCYIYRRFSPMARSVARRMSP